MASTARPPVVPADELRSFSEHLQSSTRILTLLGAGLSASSGLPTFRGAGGLWRTHTAQDLATPWAWARDPALVWQFYNYRRHMALSVQPNRAHIALANLSHHKPGFLTLTQNVDGLSQRAGHPLDKLKLLHGSLFDVKCSDFWCKYKEQNNFTDPIVPALAIPTDETDLTSNEARRTRELDISDAEIDLPEISLRDLPHCPECKHGVLRPGVVWFGEALPADVISAVDDFIQSSRKIDLIMVIGTSASVYPAASYVDTARAKGARVAVVNMDRNDEPASGMMEGDWFFAGDAAQIVPEILKSVIGETPEYSEL
ncbi:MAG: hypothetical protein Q9165_006627 [Trypethelium subeluteriae]